MSVNLNYANVQNNAAATGSAVAALAALNTTITTGTTPWKAGGVFLRGDQPALVV